MKLMFTLLKGVEKWFLMLEFLEYGISIVFISFVCLFYYEKFIVKVFIYGYKVFVVDFGYGSDIFCRFWECDSDR